MTAPDFFLIGAPKCGTTSLAASLAQHDEVFMCAPKEPFFFCTDIAAQRAARTWEEYLRLFGDAKGARRGRGLYQLLRSRVAVPAILERLPDVRFVVCLRNPVDMVASVHGQMLRGVREDERDLGAALALEPERLRGLRLPHGTNEPADLIYTQTCAIGSQLARLYESVDRNRVHRFSGRFACGPWVWSIAGVLGVNDDGRPRCYQVRACRSVIGQMLRGLRAKNRSCLAAAWGSEQSLLKRWSGNLRKKRRNCRRHCASSSLADSQPRSISWNI